MQAKNRQSQASLAPCRKNGSRRPCGFQNPQTLWSHRQKGEEARGYREPNAYDLKYYVRLPRKKSVYKALNPFGFVKL